MSPFLRLWNVIRRPQLDRELKDEVATHLALIEEEARANGESDAAARQQARVRFGSPLAHREQALDAVIATSIESAWKELGFAARRLVRSPAFTIAAVLTLALAIAANAAIFAVVERVLLNPLPYPDSDRLVYLDHGALAFNRPQGFGITRGYYYLYMERAHSLENLAIYAGETATLTGTGEPERIDLMRATPSLASVMRVSPVAGRWFTGRGGTAWSAAARRAVAWLLDSPLRRRPARRRPDDCAVGRLARSHRRDAGVVRVPECSDRGLGAAANRAHDGVRHLAVRRCGAAARRRQRRRRPRRDDPADSGRDECVPRRSLRDRQLHHAQGRRRHSHAQRFHHRRRCDGTVDCARVGQPRAARRLRKCR